MKTITLLNSKGGVGKTMFATHLAAGMARRGCKVLLIDADGQGNATTACGHGKQPIFHDLIVRDMDWRDAIVRVAPEVYTLEGGAGIPGAADGSLWLVPGNNETRSIPGQIEDETLIARRVRELEGVFDVVIFDTSPTASLLHSSIHAGTDYLLIPTQLEADSALDGTRNTVRRAQNIRRRAEEYGLNICEVIGIVPNLYRSSTNLHAELLDRLQGWYGDLVWEPVRQRTIIAEAKLARRMTWAYGQDTAAGKAAAAELDQVVERTMLALGGVSTHV